MLARVIERNPKYPVADRIEHLTPTAVSDIAGAIKDPDAIRNIVKYSADESTRARILYRVAINTNAPSDALEEIAKADKSAHTGKALYKHPNATPELKRSLTDRSDELRALGRIDELRESDPKGMAEFESSTERITADSATYNKIQFDPEVRKRTKLTDEEVEVYARDTINPSGKYDPETNIFSYITEPAGGRWTGD
jgi:HEAT repeat protein